MTKINRLLVLLILIGFLAPWAQHVQAGAHSQSEDEPVVRVVMFWLQTCGHCEYVINEVLPPLQDQYGDQLEVLLIELVTQEDVDNLYETASLLGIPPNNVGVPFMLVGDRVLKGSDEIPSQLPGLIETHLVGGGLDFPSYAPLEGYLPASIGPVEPAIPSASTETVEEPADGSSPEEISAIAQEEAAAEQFSNGFTIALVVLVGMVLALVYVLFALLRDREPGSDQPIHWLDYLIPIVALAGIGVAGYLTYVETTAVEAICGPIGDCNSVQSSPYARVFGVLPVGILGLIGYAAILIAWGIQNLSRGRWADYTRLAVLGMAIFGTLYSIYLTYLELWVIRAVCMWCVSSAVLIAVLMLLSVQPAVEALDALGEEQ